LEDDAARPEPTVGSAPADPELISRLQRLEEEAAALREKLQDPTAEGDSAEKPPEPEEELVPATPEQLAAAENLIRQARLARSRGQSAQASEFLKQAEAVAPTAPTVLEFIGDDYAERGQMKQAREAYRKAVKLAPKNVAIERKFAEAVLRGTSYGSPELFADYEVTANAKIALVLTIILPGLGQIVTAEVVKGASILLVWGACWMWALLTPGGIKGLLDTVFARGNPGDFHAIILFPLAIATIVHIGAIFDCAMKAKHSDRPKISHPVPPDSRPFE
jgi:tetratricopeptide (TPR) repeat protein